MEAFHDWRVVAAIAWTGNLKCCYVVIVAVIMLLLLLLLFMLLLLLCYCYCVILILIGDVCMILLTSKVQ
jgi:hypothetical protein